MTLFARRAVIVGRFSLFLIRFVYICVDFSLLLFSRFLSNKDGHNSTDLKKQTTCMCTPAVYLYHTDIHSQNQHQRHNFGVVLCHVIYVT